MQCCSMAKAAVTLDGIEDFWSRNIYMPTHGPAIYIARTHRLTYEWRLLAGHLFKASSQTAWESERIGTVRESFIRSVVLNVGREEFPGGRGRFPGFLTEIFIPQAPCSSPFLSLSLRGPLRAP